MEKIKKGVCTDAFLSNDEIDAAVTLCFEGDMVTTIQYALHEGITKWRYCCYQKWPLLHKNTSNDQSNLDPPWHLQVM
eukprot:13466084-Ditylum_brightwellii.AAC.1